MANPLTGDFEAVLQVSGNTVNRLLATMHQNAGSKPSLPSFPHGVWIRVGDPNPIDGMRGNILGQISVPRIDLIHGVSDRFWLEVSVRARYTPDPGSVPLPEFINGTVRAQYRIDNIDPDCRGWEKLAADYIWVRCVGGTVTFTGTAEDDSDFASVAQAVIDPATADARITRLAEYLLMQRFEATPHKVSRRFRRGSMRSLNVGANRSVVAVPIGLSGDPSAGKIDSINQDILQGRDVGIAVSREFIMDKVQRELDNVRDSFQMGMRFYHKTNADFGLFDVDVLTVTIDYTIKLTSATAQWLGGMVPMLGVTVPGGLISIAIHGQARTQKPIFNIDFDATQLLLISFDAATESFTAAPFGSAAVSLSGAFGSIVEPFARPRIQSEIATTITNASSGMVGELSLAGRKDDLIKQLQTMDDNANVWFDGAAFTPDGLIVRGTIALTGRRKPVLSNEVTVEKDGYTAYQSWMPGGRVDSFRWSWKWFNNAGAAGSATTSDRFVLRRPPQAGQGKFGVMLGLRRPLPGLDGMGQVCLVVDGMQVHAATGNLVPASTARRCKRFGLDIRLATPDRIFVREWVPGPRDPIGPVAEGAIHQVGGADAQGHGANTLVVRADRWNSDLAASLREGLANSGRRDAGLVVLVLFSDGRLMQAGAEWIGELNELAAELEAPLLVNEDVRGSWAKALGMESQDGTVGDVEWRLISPTGGVTWARSGHVESRELAQVLDAYLFRSPVPDAAHVIRELPLGSRLSGAAFESDVIGRYTDIEAACPPPPFGRLGIETSVTFVTKGSKASDAAIRKLASESGNGTAEKMRAVVFDGATAEETEELRRSLPDGVLAIPDPDGSISKRFGVRVWPSSLSFNESGLAAESGSDEEQAESQQQSSQAS